MSVRLRGLSADHSQSKRECSYLNEQDVIHLTDFPCEMTFEASSMYLEHESKKHHYLPYLHFVGQITELKGDFPYDVSTVYFGEEDMGDFLSDVYYYPTPDELAYLIQKGRLYSGDFSMSDILSGNTYSLPANVDLTVVPPVDEVSYRETVRSGNVQDYRESMDKGNVPIVYARLKGSGVSKETDRLLRYYGLDFDADFPLFVMTAEASGYTDPPLISQDYWPEPEHKEEQAGANLSDYYITPEEEAELMKAQRSESQAEAQEELVPEPAPVNREDMLLMQADQRIAQRVAKRRLDLSRSRDAERERAEEPAPELVEAKDLDAGEDGFGHQGLDADGFMSLEPEPESGHGQEKLSEPDVLQQQADVKMDLNPEENAYVEEEREGSGEAEEVLESDDGDVEKLESADVSDARAQAKVNEANARNAARDAAVNRQEERREERKEPDGRKENRERHIPGLMQEMADAYDKSRGGADGSAPDFS